MSFGILPPRIGIKKECAFEATLFYQSGLREPYGLIYKKSMELDFPHTHSVDPSFLSTAFAKISLRQS